MKVRHFEFRGIESGRKKRVNTITETANKQLWVGNGIGLWRLNRASGQLERIVPEKIDFAVNTLLSDGENRYWGGSIKNICIENIHADNAEVPAILTGYETTKNDGSVVRRPLENITVNSYHVIYRDNKEIIEIPETFDEFLEDYPESNAHGDVDAYGIWARHIDNLVLEDINVVPRSCNTRKAICLYDVNNKN